MINSFDADNNYILPEDIEKLKVVEKKYCLNGEVIPKNMIPYNGYALVDRDIIENKSGIQLVYLKSFWGYSLLSNNLADFLTEDMILQEWTKI